MNARVFRALRQLGRTQKVILATFFGLRLGTVALDLSVIYLLAEVLSRLALLTGSPETPQAPLSSWLDSMSTQSVASLVIFAYLVRMLVVLSITRAMLLFVARLESESAEKLTSKLFAKGLRGFSELRQADVQWTVIQSAEYAITKTITLTFQLVTELITILVILVFLLITRIEWAIIGAAYFLLAATVLQVFLNGALKRAGVRFAESTRESGEQLLGLVRSYRDLAVLGGMTKLIRELGRIRWSLALSNAHSSFLKTVPRYYIEVFSVIAFAAAAVWVSEFGVMAEDLETIALFVAASLRLVSSLVPAQVALAHLKFAGEQSEAALSLFERAETETDFNPLPKDHSKDQYPHDWTLVLRDVSFRFLDASEPVWSGVNFSVQPGEMVAIVGPSGFGKTTLLDVCAGIREPESGSVAIGNSTPEEVALNWPGSVAYVSQKPNFLAASWLENLGPQSGEDDLDLRWLEHLIDGVGMKDWRLGLPNGLEARYGHSVDRLSGGQLQRLAIVRAMYSSPQLVFLDEATSNLEGELEQSVVDFFRTSLPHAASVWVTHRPIVVDRSDKVLPITDFV